MAHSAVDSSWPAYSIHQLYAEAGGTGANGVDVRTVMGICIDKGAPLVSGARDKIIKSYAFVDRTPGAFRTQVKASIAAGHPVLVASLLPIPFGWNTGMVLSSGYHQYLGVGFFTEGTTEWLVVLNDWGDFWPGDAPAGTPKGVGRISFDALEQNNGQNGYTYGVIPTTTLITPPPPPPPSQRTLSAVATGAGISLLAVGQDLAVGNVNLHITQISDGNPPPPPPPSLTVTGYDPNPVESTHPVSILGSGFTSAPVVLWNSQSLSANRVSDTQLSAVAPTVASSTSGAVTVQIGTASATGPGLTVTPPGGGGGGGGGGDLLVTLTPGRGHWLYAVVQDRQTQEYLTSTCHCTVGGVDLGVSTTTKQAPSALAARWYYGSHTGQAVVNVSTSDHRSGTTSLQL